MSYTTYHSIKQLDNGDFLVKTKESNDDCKPATWAMDYYRKTFPHMSNEQRQAAFLLHGLFYGNRYYPERWKRLDKLVSEYSEKVFAETGKRPYDSLLCYPSEEAYARETRLYCEQYPNSTTPKPYSEYVAERQTESLIAVNGLIDYINHAPDAEKKGRYIIWLASNGYYVESMRTNSRMIRLTPYVTNARTFNATQTEVDKLVARIPAYMGAHVLNA